MFTDPLTRIIGSRCLMINRPKYGLWNLPHETLRTQLKHFESRTHTVTTSNRPLHQTIFITPSRLSETEVFLIGNRCLPAAKYRRLRPATTPTTAANLCYCPPLYFLDISSNFLMLPSRCKVASFLILPPLSRSLVLGLVCFCCCCRTAFN